MANVQKRADAMIQGIRKKEKYLQKLNQEVEIEKRRFEKTMTSSEMLRIDLMKLEKQLTVLKEKEQRIERTNSKLSIIQQR